MKVLILSCGAGGGYTTVALAVKEKLEEHGHEVTLLDLHSLVGESLLRVRWNLFRYRKDDQSENRVQQYLQENEFDVIVVTHVLPAVILSLMRSGHVPLPKLIYIVAEYSSVPFIEEMKCDYYVLPSQKLMAEFCRRGISKDQILPAGIPVRREFLNGRSREEARTIAGVGGDVYEILLWAENIRTHKLLKTVKTVHRFLNKYPQARLTIAGICREKDYLRAEEACRGTAQIRLVEGNPDRAVYMKACDVMICGANGLLSTEAAVLGTPLIQLVSLAGNERRNAEFFQRYGMSMAVKQPGPELIRRLEELSREGVCNDMVKAQHFHISQLAAAEICSLVESPMMTVEAESAGMLV